MSADNATQPVSHADPTKSDREPKLIATRRAERELFFWTARESLKLVLFAALVVYVVVSVVRGRLPGAEMLLRYV